MSEACAWKHDDDTMTDTLAILDDDGNDVGAVVIDSCGTAHVETEAFDVDMLDSDRASAAGKRQAVQGALEYLRIMVEALGGGEPGRRWGPGRAQAAGPWRT